jgi:CheY-like chemotaxis protein
MILTPYCLGVPQLLKEDDGCDLILTDMQMPLVDGAEFTRMAKTFYRKREKASPHIFFCSADYSRSLADIADDVGAQGTYSCSFRVHLSRLQSQRMSLNHIFANMYAGVLQKPISITDLSSFLDSTMILRGPRAA